MNGTMKEINHAFEKLKPLCIELAKEYSTERLNQLQRECEDLDPACFQLLQEYLLFPVRLSLKREKNESICIECIQFSWYVFQKTKILSWDLFHDYIRQIFFYISRPVASKFNFHAGSEELKIAICNCTETMLIKCSEIQENIYSQDFCLELAQYIFTLLDLLKKETSKLLRLSVVKALSAFLYVNVDIIKTPTVARKAGNRLAAFLPGISIGFKDVICGDIKQGHAIFTLALSAFGDFLIMLIGDDQINDDDEEFKDDRDSRIPQIIRNSAWLRSISNNLEIIITKTCEITSHEHWEVRKELSVFATKLLCHCSKNLPNCISPLLQVLFILNVDEYEQVVISSQNGVQKFSEEKTSVKSFSSILEEDIFKITSKLIKINLSTNDSQKLQLLKTLQGYFELLGTSINSLLYSFPHLDRFLLSLLNLVRFEYSDTDFFSQRTSIMTFTEKHPKLWPRLKFKYFDNDDITTRIHYICNLLCCYGDLHLLIDYLLDKFNTSYKNESLFLLNCFIKSMNSKEFLNVVCCTKNAKDNVANSVIDVILKSLLALDVWKFSPFCISQNSESTPDDFKENILQLCLVLESIALCSQVLRKEFCIYLIDILCPVMEKAGSSNSMISQVGNLALCDMANSCGYESVSDLIIENADYLVNSITVSFYHFQNQSESIVVLQVVVEHCNDNILPLIKGTIFEMIKMMDLHQEKSLSVMKVLKSVVMAIKRWFNSDDTKKRTPSCIKSCSKNSLSSAILERHRLRQQETAFLRDSPVTNEFVCDKNEEESLTNDEEAEQKESPLYIKVIIEILSRCVHMLSSNYLELVILTLEIIDASLIALSNDNDKVLPYVHKLWSPLVCHFSSNTITLRKAFETLIIIAETCGDFIKSRTMKEVWPKILAFLKSQVTVSASKKDSSNFCVTANYKLLLLVLSKIGYLASKLELTEKEFEMLVSSCLPYLHENHPDSLQEAAKQTLNYFAIIDADALWFHYNETFGCKTDYIPSTSTLETVYFPIIPEKKH